MADPSAAVAEGRRAAAARSWEETYDAFSAADIEALDIDDLTIWGVAAHLVGQVDSAVVALTEAFKRCADRPSQAVKAGMWLTYMFASRGDAAQAAGWSNRCNALAGDLAEGDVAHGYLHLMAAHRLVAIEGKMADGIERAEQAVASARHNGDGDLLALSLNILGRGLISAGRSSEGLEILDEAMVGVFADELSPTVSGTLYCSVIEACEQIGEFARSHEWTDALTRWCERQKGMTTFSGQCLTHRAILLRRGGELDQALNEARRAVEHFARGADRLAAGRAHYEIGEIHRLRGDYDAAMESYERASAWGHEPEPGLSLTQMARGNLTAVKGALSRLGEPGSPETMIRNLPAVVELAAAVDDRKRAASAAEGLRRLADSLDTPALRAEAEMAAGTVALLSSSDSAIGPLERACAIWRDLGFPHATARCLLLLASAHERAGDAEQGKRRRQQAGQALDEMGAVLPYQTSPDSPLSPRETEVLRLVATGRTNQQIAEDLYVAVRTVDRHVANILAKLGVSSRTAATSYGYEHGLI